MAVDACTDVERLVAQIDRAARTAERALEVPRASVLVERDELRRQLASLRERTARAQEGGEDPRAARSELATLLFFARTLEADVAAWREGVDAAIREHVRQVSAARRERERRAAEREELTRRRDALQSAIVEAAARTVRTEDGDFRNTLPVYTLAAGLTVCSVSVSSPRRRLRFPKHWLVTLNDTRDEVQVRRT